MATEVTLPELGENVEAAVVAALLVSPGDRVEVEQPLLELETDKATAELPSPVAGRVRTVHVEVGDEVRVGQALVTIDEVADARAEPAAGAAGPDPIAPAAAAPPAAPEPAPAPAALPPASPPPARAERGGAKTSAADVPAGPSARRLARELGLDLAEVEGSGPAGRVSVEDVVASARRVVEAGRAVPAPTESAGLSSAGGGLPDLAEWGPVAREPMSGVRRKTAQTIARAWSTVPQVTQNDRADVTDLEALRQRWSDRAVGGAKLTVTAVVIKVVASALRLFPKLNAAVDMERREVVYRQYVNVGVAVDAGHGLLVPVLRDVDQKGVLRIAAELADLSRRARDKKLGLEEMRGAGFTVSNLGGLGTTTFTPIVSWPEVAILGVGRAEQAPVWDGAGFVPRLLMPLSLSYDHRLIDGAEAARFLRFVARALEDPTVLVFEG